MFSEVELGFLLSPLSSQLVQSLGLMQRRLAYCEQAFCTLAKCASEDGRVSFQIEINIFVPQNCFLDMQGVLI